MGKGGRDMEEGGIWGRGEEVWGRVEEGRQFHKKQTNNTS